MPLDAARTPIPTDAPLLTVRGIRAVEAAALAASPQPGLMQRAGAAAAEWVRELTGDRPDPILILVGPGNNGGDALVCATELIRRGYACCCVSLSKNVTEYIPGSTRVRGNSPCTSSFFRLTPDKTDAATRSLWLKCPDQRTYGRAAMR